MMSLRLLPLLGINFDSDDNIKRLIFLRALLKSIAVLIGYWRIAPVYLHYVIYCGIFEQETDAADTQKNGFFFPLKRCGIDDFLNLVSVSGSSDSQEKLYIYTVKNITDCLPHPEQFANYWVKIYSTGMRHLLDKSDAPVRMPWGWWVGACFATLTVPILYQLAGEYKKHISEETTKIKGFMIGLMLSAILQLGVWGPLNSFEGKEYLPGFLIAPGGQSMDALMSGMAIGGIVITSLASAAGVLRFFCSYLEDQDTNAGERLELSGLLAFRIFSVLSIFFFMIIMCLNIGFSASVGRVPTFSLPKLSGINQFSFFNGAIPKITSFILDGADLVIDAVEKSLCGIK